MASSLAVETGSESPGDLLEEPPERAKAGGLTVVQGSHWPHAFTALSGKGLSQAGGCGGLGRPKQQASSGQASRTIAGAAGLSRMGRIWMGQIPRESTLIKMLGRLGIKNGPRAEPGRLDMKEGLRLGP